MKQKKSYMLPFFAEKFEALNTIGKLALSMLILKSVLISALISIIFIFYGEHLLVKYQVETRFPRLATVIKLRRKFSRYYLIVNCLMIAVIILFEVFVYVSILLI